MRAAAVAVAALAAAACRGPTATAVPSPPPGGGEGRGEGAATSTTTAHAVPSPPPSGGSWRGLRPLHREGRGEGATADALPPPLPPPEALQPPLRAEPADPLDLLWSHRLNFAAGGAPLVAIRLAEGQDEIAFRPRARARLRARGGAELWLAPDETYRVRALDALPAVLSHHPLLAEVARADRAGAEAARRLWEGRGQRVRARAVGGVYGIAGRVIDNRRLVLLAEGDGSLAGAAEAAGAIAAQHGARPLLFAELVSRPQGGLELLDGSGARLALGDGLLSVQVEEGAGFAVLGVEVDAPGGRGREDRGYGGTLHVVLDASGRLAAVAALPLEELLRGLVPSEMPAFSPREALRAQAVTARSNVLAQIGTRHLTDPWVLCSEVHCQAWRGEGAHHPATDAAVRDTAGEAIFGRKDRSLVDGVYSALCGGHGEDNDAVWGGLASSSLRGRPDLPPPAAARWAGGLREERRLRAFLEEAPPAWCALAGGARRDRWRWERRFAPAELEAALAPLSVGAVRSLEVARRGASGRALELRVAGSTGTRVVQGELAIRRLLRNLPSSMFVVDRDGAGWVLRGGGWGHGAGMCQWGAVGRAEAGQGYREILRAYFSGAEVARVY